MLRKAQHPQNTSKHSGSIGGQMKSTVITQDMVMAIADRIYSMLMHELRIERERDRFRSGFRRR